MEETEQYSVLLSQGVDRNFYSMARPFSDKPNEVQCLVRAKMTIICGVLCGGAGSMADQLE